MYSIFKKAAVVLCATALFACSDKLDDLNSDQENQAIEQEISATPEKGTFVSSEQAKDVAGAFFSRQNGGSTAKSSLKAFASVSIENGCSAGCVTISLAQIMNFSTPYNRTNFYF